MTTKKELAKEQLIRYEKTYREAKERAEIQATFKSRLENLNMSRSAFCDKYGLSNSWFCRLVNMQLLAGEKVLKKVEDALKSEGL